MTKKIIMIALLVVGSKLHGTISTTMNHREVTSAPLLYKQIDYANKALSIEIEPWVSGMFDPQHTMANLGINGQSTMTFNQTVTSKNQPGLGNINPEWIDLSSTNGLENYASSVTFDPQLMMYGALLHCYKQFEKVFFDVRTALIKCRTIVSIDERGGDNGGLQGPNGDDIYNAYDAFTNSSWNYGKIGKSNELVGFENIQVEFGSSTEMSSFASEHCKKYFAGFALLEIPTGSGTTAEWLFEPQAGTNHWGFGAGADFMIVADNGFSLVLGGNYRYLIANWETRSFDLTANGQWSRYLGLELLSTIPGPAIEPLPGINLFTQDALIEGRSQITTYARLQKRFEACLFELSYNFFYTQKETINLIDDIATGYGIWDVYSEGGVTTASTATISQSYPYEDTNPVMLVTSDLNLLSGAAGAWMSNSVAARLQRVKENYTYGVGADIDLAHSQQAISTWSVWANFEVLLS